MNRQTDLLAVAMYALLGTAVTVAVILGFRSYQLQQQLDAARAVVSTSDPEPSQAVHLDVSGSREASEGLEPGGTTELHAERILKQLLDDRSKQLQAKTEQLKKKNEQYEQLKRRYDDAVTVALDLLSEQLMRNPQAGDNREELARELELARMRQQELVQELETIQQELVAADLEMMEVREEAEQAIVDQLQELVLLQEASSTAFRQVGVAAVPALIQAVRSQEPEVRRWACQMLGRIGPDARDASDALNVALNDDNPSVRTAAREAMRSISE